MKKGVLTGLCLLLALGLFYVIHNNHSHPQTVSKKTSSAHKKASAKSSSKKTKTQVKKDPYKKYDHLQLIDTLNHDASESLYQSTIQTWNKYHVHKVVLMGDMSEPSAQATDDVAWTAYKEYPNRIIPFFAGVNIHSKKGLTYAKQKLEKGYYGVGEIAAASTYSQIVSDLPWKAKSPMDGIFPQLYKLCAKYKAPLILHIDPPFGDPIDKLEQALDKYPHTKIIFAHANTYNSPDSLERLMKAHPNLYISIFAGFTAYNPDSSHKLKDFVPLIKEFPNRVLLCSDSAYGITYKEAYKAIYQLIDLLDPKTAKKVASQNFESIIQAEPATQTQIRKLKILAKGKAITIHYDKLNKIKANQWLFKLEKKK